MSGRLQAYVAPSSEFDHVFQRRFDNTMARRNPERVVMPVWAQKQPGEAAR